MRTILITCEQDLASLPLCGVYIKRASLHSVPESSRKAIVLEEIVIAHDGVGLSEYKYVDFVRVQHIY
jgi:hypothetical protein